MLFPAGLKLYGAQPGHIAFLYFKEKCLGWRGLERILQGVLSAHSAALPMDLLLLWLWSMRWPRTLCHTATCVTPASSRLPGGLDLWRCVWPRGTTLCQAFRLAKPYSFLLA